MYFRTMAGRPHAREFLVDPAMVMTNNAIIAERLTLVRLIRGIGNDDIQILEWLARHRLITNSKTCPICNNNAKLDRFNQGIDKWRWRCNLNNL